MKQSKKNEEVVDEKKSIIRPLIQVDQGLKHPLEDVFNNPALLKEMKAVSMIRVPGRNTFCSALIRFKGDQIISIEVGEPNLKAIAVDEAKINFVNEFLNEDFNEL